MRAKREFLFEAYFDESGDENTEVLTIAGFLSTDARWRKLSTQWNYYLHLTGVSFVHMREFAFSRGQFEGWSEQRKVALSKKLIGLLKTHAIAKVSASLNTHAYKDIFPQALQKRFGNAYYFLLRWIVSETLELSLRLKYTGKVNLIFDSHSKLSARARRIYRIGYEEALFLEQPYRDRLGTMVFGDDKLLPPLQAADILAYEISKYLRGSRRRAYQELETISGPDSWWGEKELSQYLTYIAKSPFADKLLK